MKLEEIEEALCSEDAELYQNDKDLARKLIAVAKAAKLISEGMHDENYFVMGWELLEQTLEELEDYPKSPKLPSSPQPPLDS